MKPLTLVILAAGMGTRYGGAKQLASVTNYRETLVDFSIYDAVQAGFTKVVFVVSSAILSAVKAHFEAALSGKITTLFVCQDQVKLPGVYSAVSRKKPWGTGHALLAAKAVVQENFCVINADDFYGQSAFVKMASCLTKTAISSASYAMMGYKVQNTLSANGGVSRGECEVKNGFLEKITERLGVQKDGKEIYYIHRAKEQELLHKDTLVSMNFWGFTPEIFSTLEEEFVTFLKINKKSEQAEFFLPTVVNTLLQEKKATVFVEETSQKWMGITYKEDKKEVVARLQQLKMAKKYPVCLWSVESWLKTVVASFCIEGVLTSFRFFDEGHINDTYLIETNLCKKYVLQRLNEVVFPDIPALIANKVAVSQFLQSKNETAVELDFIAAKTGLYYFKDALGFYWNASLYIPESVCYLKPPTAAVVREAGSVLGLFLARTKPFPIENLQTTLPNFHSVTVRLQEFKKAVATATPKRLEVAKDLLFFVTEQQAKMIVLDEALVKKELTLQVTHNDPKISNILFSKSGAGICMIDTDTVMPGLLQYDYGDAIRTVCATAAEDEEDVTKMEFQLSYFKKFTDGFLGAYKQHCTAKELSYFPISIQILPFLIGLRFLTDFLHNDIYYKTKYTSHNLVRATNQFQFLRSVQVHEKGIDVYLSKWSCS